MESMIDIPTEEDKNFIVDAMVIIMMRTQHMSLKIPPHQMKTTNMLLLLKSLKNLLKKLENLVVNLLIIQLVKITNM